MPKRIQRKRTKGWRMPKNTIYVGRPTKWGNPFKIGCKAWQFSMACPYLVPNTLEETIANYEYMIDVEVKLGLKSLDELKGKDLACWCPLHKPCHADVLLRLANQ